MIDLIICKKDIHPQRLLLPRYTTATCTSPGPITVVANSLLQLLLWAQLVGVAALLLAAVGGTWRKAGVALSADHLLAVVLGGEGLERWLNDTTTETEDQVEGRLLLISISKLSSKVQ